MLDKRKFKNMLKNKVECKLTLKQIILLSSWLKAYDIRNILDI